MPVAISPAPSTSIPEVSALIRASLRHVSAQFYTERQTRILLSAYTPRALRTEHAKGAWYVASRENRIFGMLAWGAEKHTSLLTHFFVHPREQGRGVGAALFEYLVEDAFLAIPGGVLRVYALRGAEQFYRSRGLRQGAKMTIVYDGGDIPGIELCANLERLLRMDRKCCEKTRKSQRI